MQIEKISYQQPFLKNGNLLRKMDYEEISINKDISSNKSFDDTSNQVESLKKENSLLRNELQDVYIKMQNEYCNQIDLANEQHMLDLRDVYSRQAEKIRKLQKENDQKFREIVKEYEVKLDEFRQQMEDLPVQKAALESTLRERDEEIRKLKRAIEEAGDKFEAKIRHIQSDIMTQSQMDDEELQEVKKINVQMRKRCRKLEVTNEELMAINECFKEENEDLRNTIRKLKLNEDVLKRKQVECKQSSKQVMTSVTKLYETSLMEVRKTNENIRKIFSNLEDERNTLQNELIASFTKCKEYEKRISEMIYERKQEKEIQVATINQLKVEKQKSIKVMQEELVTKQNNMMDLEFKLKNLEEENKELQKTIIKSSMEYQKKLEQVRPEIVSNFGLSHGEFMGINEKNQLKTLENENIKLKNNLSKAQTDNLGDRDKYNEDLALLKKLYHENINSLEENLRKIKQEKQELDVEFRKFQDEYATTQKEKDVLIEIKTALEEENKEIKKNLKTYETKCQEEMSNLQNSLNESSAQYEKHILKLKQKYKEELEEMHDSLDHGSAKYEKHIMKLKHQYNIEMEQMQANLEQQCITYEKQMAKMKMQYREEMDQMQKILEDNTTDYQKQISKLKFFLGEDLSEANYDNTSRKDEKKGNRIKELLFCVQERVDEELKHYIREISRLVDLIEKAPDQTDQVILKLMNEINIKNREYENLAFAKNVLEKNYRQMEEGYKITMERTDEVESETVELKQRMSEEVEELTNELEKIKSHLAKVQYEKEKLLEQVKQLQEQLEKEQDNNKLKIIEVTKELEDKIDSLQMKLDDQKDKYEDKLDELQDEIEMEHKDHNRRVKNMEDYSENMRKFYEDELAKLSTYLCEDRKEIERLMNEKLSLENEHRNLETQNVIMKHNFEDTFKKYNEKIMAQFSQVSIGK